MSSDLKPFNLDLDQCKVAGGALALCHMRCVEATKGGMCEKHCIGSVDLKMYNSPYMQELRRQAYIVLNAKPAVPPVTNIDLAKRYYETRR